MVELFIAYRHIIERKFQSIFSVLGVAIAVTVFVVSLTVSNGLEKNMISSLLTLSPHILIRNAKDSYFEGYQDIIEKTKDIKDVKAVIPQIRSQSIIKFKGFAKGVLAEGLSAENVKNNLNLKIIKGNSNISELNSILIGEELSKELDIKVGDELSLISSDNKEIKLIIRGIFKTGFSEFLTEISSGILILIYNLVILRKIGVLGVSIFGTVSYITSFITMTMIGFSQGIQPVISYYLGKKNYKNLKEILKISTIFLGLLGIFCFIFISLFSEYIGKIFFREQDMILYVKRVLKIYSLSYLLIGINIFISAYFTAIKKVIYSALITFPRGILFNSILLLILPNIFGNKVIWIVSFLSEVLTIFICIYLLKKIKKEGILN